MKRLKIISKLLFISSLIFTIGCDESNSSSEPINQGDSSTSIPAQDSQYNPDNFIESETEVTQTKVVTYDGPSYLHSKDGVSIKVNDKSLFVYETLVNYQRKFSWDVPTDTVPVAYFDFEGIVHVEITISTATVVTAQVSPLAYGIKPVVADNKITFDLKYSDNYTIEYNDDYKTAIHLFANPLEKDPITKEMAANDSSIIYIGPGVYKADAIPTKSNSTIYIAGGAYVYGQIRTEGLENITIRGRGIISGSIYYRRSEAEYTIPIVIRSSENITISDIIFLDPAGWTITLFKSKDIQVNNVKIITARQNGDGISVQSCENVFVKRGFVRTWDDSLVVKNVERSSTSNVNFDEVIVWTDLAQSMEVGFETYGPTMDGITFKNITVLHNFHKAAISLHNSDDANITNVKYENITIEDAQMLGDIQDDGESDFLIDMTIAYSIDWTKSEGVRGSVDGVTINNVKVLKMADSIVCRFNGESEPSKIKNVNISNITIEGQNISTKEQLNVLANDYTENITVTSSKKAIGAITVLPYKTNITNQEVLYTKYENIVQDGMQVPQFAILNSDLPYIGVASHGKYQVLATHGAGTKTSTPSSDGSGDFTADGFSCESIVDNDTSTTWKSKEWKNEESEFTAITVDFVDNDSNPVLNKVGVVRILGNLENKFFYTYNVQVWGRKVKSDGTINANYVRLGSAKDYEMSPSSGNCFDINISTTDYAGIQLRLYRTDSVTSSQYYEISEIQFYPPSLAFNKTIVDSTAHNDVYNVEKIIDGDATGTSYYESAELPATVIIDLGDLYTVNTFVLCLPPILSWDARTQKIAIYGSDSTNSYNKDTTTFQTLVEEQDFLFDPSVGNRNIVNITATQIRFVKLVITSNDIKGGYDAQLSEFSVYGD